MSTKVMPIGERSWLKTVFIPKKADIKPIVEHSKFDGFTKLVYEISTASAKQNNSEKKIMHSEKPKVEKVVVTTNAGLSERSDAQATPAKKVKKIDKEVKTPNTLLITRTTKVTTEDCITSSKLQLHCDKLNAYLGLTYITNPIIPEEEKDIKKKKIKGFFRKLFRCNKGEKHSAALPSKEKHLPEIVLSRTNSQWKEKFMIAHKAEWERFKYLSEVVAIC